MQLSAPQGAVTCEVAGQALQLLPQRVAYVPAHRSLLVADAHFGKAQSFRRLGVPVPAGTTQDNLRRLDNALRVTGAEQVVFLGDLLHSVHAQASGALQALAAWRHQHAQLHCVLVRGNHDARAGDPPPNLEIKLSDEPWFMGTWALCHHPRVAAGHYVLSGHLHPGLSLAATGRSRLRLPCFWFGRDRGVLPAFGDFTGLHQIRPAPQDQVFVVADDHVLPVPTGVAGG